MRRIHACAVLVWALFLAASVVAVSAEVLVTTDGSEIEIRGTWEQRGRMIVFTNAGGQLASLRAEDVDLEATRRRNEAGSGAEASEPSASSPPKARIVITDADVAHADPAPIADDDGTATEAAESATNEESAAGADAGQSPVRVIAWDEEEPTDGEGRVIFGTLRNDGNSFATGITLEISVYEDGGALAGTQTVTPVQTSLRPGESTTFRAQFRSVYVVGATQMTVRSLDLDVGDAETRADDTLDEG